MTNTILHGSLSELFLEIFLLSWFFSHKFKLITSSIVLFSGYLFAWVLLLLIIINQSDLVRPFTFDSFYFSNYDQWHTVVGYSLKCCCIWKLWKMDHIILVLFLKLNLKINNEIFHMLLGIWCLSSLSLFHVKNVIGYYLWAFLKFNNAACCDVQSFQAMGSFKLQVFSIDCVKSSDKVWNDKNFSKKL